MENLPDIAQGSEAWFALRVGKVTASRVSDVIAKTKTGWGASRANYMAELIAERLTGTAAQSYTNAAMQWGLDNEPLARAAYEFFRDATVNPVGFVIHPQISMSGASPDGLIEDDGLLEIKCPNTGTHIETLLGEKIADKYIVQMQWQMACTGRKWCDFVSFDPRMPQKLSIFVKRIERDGDRIKELESAINEFLAELEKKVFSLHAVSDGTMENNSVEKSRPQINLEKSSPIF